MDLKEMITKGMTNGEKLKEIFPTCETRQSREGIIDITFDESTEVLCVISDWFNSPYSAESGEKGITNGEKLKETFPTCIERQGNEMAEVTLDGLIKVLVSLKWWNALYCS